jgi:tripartite-type tricarboxylate transporter receptor subunit TctC
MRSMLGTMLLGAVAAGGAVTAAPATAQGYPSKVVRLVVPFAAGGSNDIVARAMSAPLSRALGQSVVVENRPGANTIIGTEAVARSPADGHTALISGFTFASLAALRSNLPFEPLKDFAGVAGLGTQPYVFSIHPSLPAKSIKELIAVARARPGQLVYAINGYGTGQHLSGELLKIMARIDMKHVAFSGGGPATVAVLGGHAGILISTAPPIMQHVQADKLRALAVTSAARSDLLKDVPTMIESGMPGFDLSGAMGIFVPAATPKAAVDRLSAEVLRVVQLPEVKDGMLRDGFAVIPLGPAEYDAAIRTKVQQIQQIARKANLKLD